MKLPEEKEDALKCTLGDFPGGPVVKTLPSNARGVGLIPGRGGGEDPTCDPGQKTKHKMEVIL